MAGRFKLQSLPYIEPLKFTSLYGQRYDGIHRAVDIGKNRTVYGNLGDKRGGPIYAVLDGTVTRNYFGLAVGHMVEITSQVGNDTVVHGYQHFFAKSPKAQGSKVRAGNIIGEMGTTGDSTGVHLHFWIKINGKPVDPKPYLTGKVNPTEEYNPSNSNGNQDISTENGTTSVKDKEITSVVVKSLQDTATNQTGLENAKSEGNLFECYIQNGDNIYLTPVEGTLTISHTRNCAKACNFTVIADGKLNFQEGNPVKINWNGKNIFYGYIFEKDRKSDAYVINVKAYDQIRYLKAKDSRLVETSASELLKSIANELKLKIGIVEDSGYKIKPIIQETSYIDMILSAMDDTVLFGGKMFVLFDDMNKLNLRYIGNLLLPIIVDKTTAQDFNYRSSIDNNTHNQIRSAMDNKETGQREITVSNDPNSQKTWGILPFYENASGVDAKLMNARQDMLMKFYNKKQRKLKVIDQIGDPRVKAGHLMIVDLFLGDIVVKNYFMVESVTHKISNCEYTMDLTLVGALGGEF